MLLPLIRLLSLVMPTDLLDPIYGYAFVGAPALIGTLLVARAIEVGPGALGLGWPRYPIVEVALAVSGLPLGAFMATAFGERMALVGDPSPFELAIVLLVFVVLLEELLFRGLLRHAASLASPRLSLFIPNVLYAAMYL